MLSPEPRRGPWFLWPGLGLLFLALAVFATWPLAPNLTSGIALGTERVATVPLFNLWTLAWNVESFERLYAGYWQAPIFHPAPHAFALSEPQAVQGFLAGALTRFGLSSLTAYNLLLLAALTINGLLATSCLRGVGLGWLASLMGGALVLLLPFTFQELGVVQLVPLAGVLTLAASIWRFSRAPERASGLRLGASLALAYGLSFQIATFAALAFSPVAVWLWWPHLRRTGPWKSLLAGALLFAVVAAPILLGQALSRGEEPFGRSLETVRKQSAQIGQYLVSAWPQRVPTPGITTAEEPSQRAFWPGTTRVLLACVALLVGWKMSSWRRFRIAAGLLLLSSLVFSLGPNLSLAGISMVDLLRALPGGEQIRSFFRFALFVQLAITGLAALGLQWIQEALGSRLGPRGALALVSALALLAITEVRLDTGPIQPLPSLDLDLPWIRWIEENTQADTALAFMPFPEGRSSADYVGTTQWMYWQTRHWRPMVNGYSGFFPAEFRRLKKIMHQFPSQESLAALHGAGVELCIVHRAFLSTPPASSQDPGAPRLVLAFRDSQHHLDIYELRTD